jgi:hypothetical protein
MDVFQMLIVHDDAHALKWNNALRSLNGMPKHRMRSNDIRKLFRTIYISIRFQILAHSNAITTCQDNRPQMFVLLFQKCVLTISSHSLLFIF